VYCIINALAFKGCSRLGTNALVKTMSVAVILVFVTERKVDAAPVYVPFNADLTASLAAPTVGLAENDNHYFTVRGTATGRLNKDLTGETSVFINPSTAKDAASFNNDYMFQLGTDNGVRKINTSTGDLSLPFDVVDAGNNAFGIGYDASSNTIGVGIYHAGNMTFKLLDGSTGSQIGSDVTFAFDSGLYGTPTGLDYTVQGGNQRMLVGTRDGIFEEELRNYILDMSASTGNIDQYVTTVGLSTKLQDLVYSNGQLTLVNQDGSGGSIQQGNFAVIPEPGTLVLVGLAGLAAALANRKRGRLRRG